MTYKIGSFNCQNFGMGNIKDTKIISDIILNEKFDIVALQEVKGGSSNKSISPLGMILQRLPSYWKGVSDTEVNDYAFIWNSRKVDLASYQDLFTTRQSTPYIYNNYKLKQGMGINRLLRNPYYARFHPVGGAAPFIEIRLINCHLRYGNSVNDIGSIGEIEKRKNEFNIITKSILAKESDKRYGNNRPAYTILLGDYNLNMPSSAASSPYLEEVFEINDGNIYRQTFDSNRGIKKIVTIQRELTTLKKNLDEDEKYSSNYDHFTFDENRFKDTLISSERIDAVEKYCNKDYKKYQKDVSDHLPIIMKFNVKKG